MSAVEFTGSLMIINFNLSLISGIDLLTIQKLRFLPETVNMIFIFLNQMVFTVIKFQKVKCMKL